MQQVAASAASPETILDYWFADALGDPDKAAARMRLWFVSDRETDGDISERFSSTLHAAGSGALAQWRSEPRSALALVIILDQFPRNIHRATPAAFAHDAQALEVTREGVAKGHLAALHPVEQAFFLMPFQHCEDIAGQREGIPLFEQMVAEAARDWRPTLAGFLDYAVLHLQIIERFGRFPHRNAILGRTSSRDELEYLRSNSESFGQAADAPPARSL